MGANPDRPITLPAGSYTEEEFTVTLSIDAQYLTGYQLRITNGGTALTGTQVAEIRLGPAPAVQLSPGQRQGIAIVDPTTTSTAGAAYPLLSARTIVAKTRSVAAVPAVYRPKAAALSPDCQHAQHFTEPLSAVDIHQPLFRDGGPVRGLSPRTRRQEPRAPGERLTERPVLHLPRQHGPGSHHRCPDPLRPCSACERPREARVLLARRPSDNPLRPRRVPGWREHADCHDSPQIAQGQPRQRPAQTGLDGKRLGDSRASRG